jgi:hypothetical protein
VPISTLELDEIKSRPLEDGHRPRGEISLQILAVSSSDNLKKYDKPKMGNWSKTKSITGRDFYKEDVTGKETLLCGDWKVQKNSSSYFRAGMFGASTLGLIFLSSVIINGLS